MSRGDRRVKRLEVEEPPVMATPKVEARCFDCTTTIWKVDKALAKQPKHTFLRAKHLDTALPDGVTVLVSDESIPVNCPVCGGEVFRRSPYGGVVFTDEEKLYGPFRVFGHRRMAPLPPGLLKKTVLARDASRRPQPPQPEG